MTKQNQQHPQQNDQQQQNPNKGDNPGQQGGQSPLGQPGNQPGSQGQPGARQSDQGSGGKQSPRESGAGAQQGKPVNQHGFSADQEDQAPGMNVDEGDRKTSEKLRKGALDAQYGTDSSSKVDQQSNRPQGSTTGSDRDTLTGARNKGG